MTHQILHLSVIMKVIGVSKECDVFNVKLVQKSYLKPSRGL